MQKQEPSKKLPLTKLNWIPKNRLERRQARRETKEIMRLLMEVDVDFTSAILTSEEDYDKLYKRYHNHWAEALRRIDAREYKIVSPNRTYFSDSFSPKNQ